MNTSHLKKFAQSARKKLLEQVGAQLEYVLTTDTAELRERADQIGKLKEELNLTNRDLLIERVAYTWFNRLVALRFMDVNDYQPLGIRVVSPKDGYTLAEILDEAKQGSIPEELEVDRKRINELLDGKIPSANPQNEVYRLLLISSCNYLSKIFPFLFERINDYTELLVPEDLISDFSVVNEVRQGMLPDDSTQVEIIGWLYQFYISEKKEELINAKQIYKPEEIAPVTQLFTPKWIVEYMVDNTLGQFWREGRPSTKITSSLKFYIKPNNPELIPKREVKSPEDIKFFDPCVGSAHVLCHAFDIFYKMYEEEGYDPSLIPELILKNNLYGIDIDDRAAQLAGFALMMKGRSYYKRFFRKEVVPNITSFKNIDTYPKFENAKVFGSLIKVSKHEVSKINYDETSLFESRDSQLRKQASLLANEYDIIVTNPPYLSSSYMDGLLKDFIDTEYPNTKSDLFACFLIQVTRLTKKNGLIGFVCPYTWMFNKSYEWLREYVILNTTISSLIQLEYNAFGPAVVPIGTFMLRNSYAKNFLGSYIKLSSFTGEENQAPRVLEAIKDPECGWFYTFDQMNYLEIQGYKFGYWAKPKLRKILSSGFIIEEYSPVRQGFQTGDNDRFIRYFWEVDLKAIGFDYSSTVEFHAQNKLYAPYNKGGEFRKWYGNNDYVVKFDKANFDLLSKMGNSLPSRSLYFQSSLTWSALSSSNFGARYNGIGFTFSAKGACSFPKTEEIGFFILGLLNSKISAEILSFFSPTLDFNVGDIRQIPIPDFSEINYLPVNEVVKDLVDICRTEWNTHENSWSFSKNELLRIKGQDLEETYDLYQQYWKKKFHQIHKYEEELNRKFIEIYGLQDELKPDVSLSNITILRDEATIENGELSIDSSEVFSQFISYAVGCIFGRYSLDKAGIITATQGESLQDYKQAINCEKISFMPDDDNIIPVLSDNWFEDDIVGRIHEFIKATYGEKEFTRNLSFLEEKLGKDIRKYMLRQFYPDHIKRYKKRPIYWMFSSPKGHFNVLIYMHRYTPDTLNNILNKYLREFIEKLKTRKEYLKHVQVSGGAIEQNKAIKESDKLDEMLMDCQEYEREILFPLASERITINLDDGVLVNYNKFGKSVKEVTGLNDKKTKKDVREFDWIDTSQIR